jgi:hypothetical protein
MALSCRGTHHTAWYNRGAETNGTSGAANSVPRPELAGPPGFGALAPADLGNSTVAKNTKKDQNNAGTDTGDLRGGTQGAGTAPVVQPGGTPGGTNSLTPTGGSHPAGRIPEPPTGDKAAAERQDPHRSVQDERTRPSPDAAAQRARDDADVEGSTSGVDEGNPRQIPEDAPTPDGRTGND